MTSHTLVAVVVTYNRLDKLKVTLARLLESPRAELSQVVVVDNASTDGTGDWLRALQDDRLDVVVSATNQGGGWRLCAGAAPRDGGP
jgi:glycosyltransferase involved in cell wall biosynthesis